MSRTLLSFSFVLLVVVSYAVPVLLPSSHPHVSLEHALASRRRAAHHVPFVIRAADSALESGAGTHDKRPELGNTDAALVDAANETVQGAAQQDVPVENEPKRQPTKQGDATQSDSQQSDSQQNDLQQSDSQQNDPQQNDPQQGDPQQTEPQQTEPQQTEPKQTEPQQTEPKQTEPQQTEPQQTEPQQTEPQQTEPQQQQNETLSNPRSEPQEDASLSKQSTQPPFNPSVSTVGFVGAIATVIVAAFLVWSKSSNNSLSPVQLASHAYQRVRTNAQDASASAQGSADADGWNAGWDDDDDWNPQLPSAKV